MTLDTHDYALRTVFYRLVRVAYYPVPKLTQVSIPFSIGGFLLGFIMGIAAVCLAFDLNN